jgi:predicted O-linked N-acetylglucosamine transferase (SPINDLY family)
MNGKDLRGLPRLDRGFWKSGSFNNGRKLNAEVIDCWAKVMRTSPDSRIRLHGLKSLEMRRWAVDMFGAKGIDEHRITTLLAVDDGKPVGVLHIHDCPAVR